MCRMRQIPRQCSSSANGQEKETKNWCKRDPRASVGGSTRKVFVRRCWDLPTSGGMVQDEIREHLAPVRYRPAHLYAAVRSEYPGTIHHRCCGRLLDRDGACSSVDLVARRHLSRFWHSEAYIPEFGSRTPCPSYVHPYIHFSSKVHVLPS